MKFIISEFKTTIKTHLWLWFKNSFLIAFIFLLLNIFLGVSIYLNSLSDQVQEKLGVFLYLNDNIIGQESEVYNKVLDMKKLLEQQDVKVEFVSKDDAFKFLDKRLPNLNKNFKKFNIDNPLQSTLYLTFKEQVHYDAIKAIVDDYKDIVNNYSDLDKGTSLHSQNNRVLGIMHLSHFIRILFYSMVGLLFLLVFFLLRHFLKVLTQQFHDNMYRKKIMGASQKDIIMPILWYTVSALVLGIILSWGITLILGLILNYYILDNFLISSFTYIFSAYFLLSLLFELILVLSLAVVLTYRYLSKVDKKLK